MMRQTVLLVDDHEIVRQGCSKVLEHHGDIAVIGEAATGLEAIEKAQELKPKVVVMDLTLPGLGGVEIIERLKHESPQIQIVVLSVHTDGIYIHRALKAGAAAYVVKRGAARELYEAIVAVAAGNMYLSPFISRSVLQAYMQNTSLASTPEGIPLTIREREVIELLSEGFSSKEIAQQLETSPRTIDVHRQHVMKKLDLHTVPDLVKYALRHKLVSLDT